jgi:transposase
MSEGKRRKFSREFKLAAIERMMAGEAVEALSRELHVPSGHLYQWCLRFRRGGARSLRRAGRPRVFPADVDADAAVTEPMGLRDLAAARTRIEDLERKIGRQQLELDFFRQALRRVGEARRPSDGPGVSASTPRSRR